jgi:tetratricopeptide (TPR) repeat protein
LSKVAKIREMLAAEPDDVFLNFTLGLELAKEGQHVEAVGCFEKVIRLDGNYSAAYLQMARSQIDLDRRDDARRTLAMGAEVAERAGDLHARDKMKELLHTLG